jgi:hypothetical protein
VGGAFLLLAIIGVATVITLSLQLTGRVLDNSQEKERLAALIRPVVMFDPVPFEAPADIPMNNLLLYCMWQTLLGEKAQNYTYNENQELVIPASDLDVACALLFGADAVLEHQSFGDYSSSYRYNPTNKTYNVRVSTELYVYSPEVREITKEGELYCLDVYYVPPGNAWRMTPAGQEASQYTEKHMYYYLSTNRNGYQLKRMQSPPEAQVMAEAE